MTRILRIGALASLWLLGAVGASCKSDDKKPVGTELADSGSTAGGSGGQSTVGGDGGTGSQTGSMTGRRDGGPSQGGGGGSQRARQVCPPAAPSNGDSCVAGRGDCAFGTLTCDCDEDTGAWACFDTTQCPAAPPAELAGCAPIGLECEYEDVVVNGEMDDLDCECSITGWDCERQVCPPTAPATGQACELALLGRSGGEGLCEYDADVCDCRGSVWTCWKPADCPAAIPAERSACMVQGMLCGYPTDECECGRRGWECESGDDDDDDDDDRPRDAGPRSDAGSPADAGSSTPADAAVSSDAAL
jgi:hypothetical protein